MSAKPHKPAPSLAGLSRETGIARETLRVWKNEGVNIFNRGELLKRAEARKHRSAGEVGTLRAEKLALECERLRRQIEREEGLWLRVEEVVAQAEVFGLLVRTRFLALANTLPDRLAGCTATEIHTVLKRELRDLLEQTAREPMGEKHIEQLRQTAEKFRHATN